MVLRVKIAPTLFPTNSLYILMGSTLLHSIPSVCRPWGGVCCHRDIKDVSRDESRAHLLFFECSIMGMAVQPRGGHWVWKVDPANDFSQVE